MRRSLFTPNLKKPRIFISEVFYYIILLFCRVKNPTYRLGEEYYQNHLQKNPVNIKDYGEISFGAKNRGKDKTRNYEQYPFLRKNLENSTKEDFSTNYKNEFDREYDYFSNTYNGDLFII